MNDCQNRFKVDSAAQPKKPSKIPCLFGLDLHMAFHKWLYPHSWMVYNGKAVIRIDDLGVSP